MEWSDAEIKLFIDNEGPFNSYVINRRLKLRLLSPLTSSTLTPAVLNNLLTAEPPSPTNVTAPSTNVTAPPINAIAPSIKAIAAVNYGRDLVTLVKIYTEESKYSGEDDNFDRKLTIFNDLCNRVGIPQEAKIKGFLTMLRGITFNFYYKNKATYTTFNSIYNAIYNHFKGLEYKRGVLIK